MSQLSQELEDMKSPPVTLTEIVFNAFRNASPHMIASIQKNNALLYRLMGIPEPYVRNYTFKIVN